MKIQKGLWFEVYTENVFVAYGYYIAKSTFGGALQMKLDRDCLIFDHNMWNSDIWLSVAEPLDDIFKKFPLYHRDNNTCTTFFYFDTEYNLSKFYNVSEKYLNLYANIFFKEAI
jgi:hypothetical protein